MMRDVVPAAVLRSKRAHETVFATILQGFQSFEKCWCQKRDHTLLGTL